MNPFTCLQGFILTSLYICGLVYIPLQLFRFSQFLIVFPSNIHYRTEDLVCQNILNVTVQHAAAGPTQ